MTTLYFDCFSGAAGDMIVGALIDAGVPLDEIRRALGSLTVAPDAVWIDRVSRAGITATKFSVRGEAHPIDDADDHEHHHRGGSHDHGRGHDHDRDHGHAHAHSHAHPASVPVATAPKEEVSASAKAAARPHRSASSAGAHHHVHRTLEEISRLIDGSALTAAGKDRAKELFYRLGEAEAAIHGTTLDRVHLHEVGALDSIVDIVGAVHALECLAPSRIVSSPLNVGSGTIRSAHGLYPVPAPATMRLLKDVPIYSGPQRAELVTPTGALLVAAYATEFGPIPAMRVTTVGYGAGTRDFADTPNVLRVLLGETRSDAQAHAVVVIEAEIDDMNPQIFGVLMDRLLSEGALDVFYTPIQMKKNRPGTLLTIVAAPRTRERLTAIVFQETTTIGVRYREMQRECLERETISVETPLGAVHIKIARRGNQILNASPEFDDCARIAAATGRPVKDVQALAMKSYLEARP